ncbi:MAG: alkaline phosphatase family protein, partial [Cyclobacteriaceae bacterium]
ETKETLLEADRLLGRIISGIENSSLPIQLIVVSDHGMYEMHYDADTYIDIGDLISFPKDAVKLANNETHIHIYVNDPENIEWIFKTLKGKQSRYRTYLREETPSRWHYNSSKRIGDILLVAEPGHAFRVASKRDTYGSHGFDPYTVPEMGTIFYAWGSRIEPGIVLEPFQNVHVYPLVAYLLGISAPTCDGDINVLKPIVKE